MAYTTWLMKLILTMILTLLFKEVMISILSPELVLEEWHLDHLVLISNKQQTTLFDLRNFWSCWIGINQRKGNWLVLLFISFILFSRFCASFMLSSAIRRSLVIISLAIRWRSFSFLSDVSVAIRRLVCFSLRCRWRMHIRSH